MDATEYHHHCISPNTNKSTVSINRTTHHNIPHGELWATQAYIHTRTLPHILIHRHSPQKKHIEILSNRDKFTSTPELSCHRLRHRLFPKMYDGTRYEPVSRASLQMPPRDFNIIHSCPLLALVSNISAIPPLLIPIHQPSCRCFLTFPRDASMTPMMRNRFWAWWPHETRDLKCGHSNNDTEKTVKKANVYI